MRNTSICSLLIAVCLLSSHPLSAAPRTGDVPFATDFEGTNALQHWQGTNHKDIHLATDSAGSQCLSVERPANLGPGSISARLLLPIEQLRGARLRIEAKVTAIDVAEPPQPYNGIKVMLHTIAPSGQKYTQRNNVFGTFDAKTVQFITVVPDEVTAAWLVLGLERTTGKVLFDDVKVKVIAVRRPAIAKKSAGPVYKGHDLPRLRGAMVGNRTTPEDLEVLGGEWGANHCRWQLVWGGFPRSPADKAGVEEYRQWLNEKLDYLDGLLPTFERLGMKVLVDLHTPPGGRDNNNECKLFKEKRFQDEFIAVWEMMARRYKGNRVIWGYDLVNEPVEGVMAEGLMDWRELATETARRVRRIDPDHAIIIEPAPWGSPESLDWFEPIDVPRVVYSVHMYKPHQFTHQGVHGTPIGPSYPGEIDGKHYDRDALRAALQSVIEFQQAYGVHIYIGEFSAIRWAPGDSAYNYLRDCISIFEENEWDWAYHAFREWDGWSVEHGPDPKNRTRLTTPTNRQELLRSWYAKNQKATK